MGLTRRELDEVYYKVKRLYRRKERDKDIRMGIDTLYDALIHYIDFDTDYRQKLR